MISRYLVLSGIQLSQTSILDEIQKLASFLLKNVSEGASISGIMIPKINRKWKLMKYESQPYILNFEKVSSNR